MLRGVAPAAAPHRLRRPVRLARGLWRRTRLRCDPDPSIACPPISCGSVAPSNSQAAEGGDIEGAGIDYLLPYWMARYFGIV